MSEYQAYYFARAERPLSGSELEAVEALSSHITVNAHSAFVDYHYGDFKHDPQQVLEERFDVLVYYANWGAQIVAFRFDQAAVDLERLQRYGLDESLTVYTTDMDVIFWAEFNDDYGNGEDYDLEYEGDAIVKLYRAVIQGDDRPLFLLWLAAMCDNGYDEDRMPIPAGLQDLNSELKDLVDFIHIDQAQIAVAAQQNNAPAAKHASARKINYAQYLDQLSQDQKTHFLKQLLTGDPHIVRADLIKELHPHIPKPKTASKTDSEPALTFLELENLAEKWRELKRQEHEAQRLAERRAYFERLEAEAQKLWQKARKLIELKQPKTYEQATEILYALKCLAIEKNDLAAYTTRVEKLTTAYPRLSSLRPRLEAAGLLTFDESEKGVRFGNSQSSWQEAHPADWLFNFNY